MEDIEVKNIEVKQVARVTKKTAYMCVWWQSGQPYFSCPGEDRSYAERYASDMAKHADHIDILKFEINVPSSFLGGITY